MDAENEYWCLGSDAENDNIVVRGPMSHRKLLDIMKQSSGKQTAVKAEKPGDAILKVIITRLNNEHSSGSF